MSGAFEGLWCIVQGKEREDEIQDSCMQSLHVIYVLLAEFLIWPHTAGLISPAVWC
jgi:hypothetical protein